MYTKGEEVKNSKNLFTWFMDDPYQKKSGGIWSVKFMMLKP